MRIDDIARRMAGQRVVVTGAGGFIGRRLTAVLARGGAQVTVLVRSRRDVPPGVRTVLCDLGAGVVPPGALAGASVLFHFAYDVRASAEANLRGFDALLAAAAQAGVGRVVHASSAVVYDDWPDGHLSERSAWGGPGGGPYRQAKIEMERRLLGGPLPAVILQPTIVYGPGSALWTGRPMAQLKSGGVVLPSPVGLCAAVHVDDVVLAALLAAVVPDPGRERFLVSGPDRMTWEDFFRGYAAMLGGGKIELCDLGPAPAPAAEGAAGPSLAARVSAAGRRLLGHRRFEALVAAARTLRPAAGPALPDAGLHRLYLGRPTIDLGHAQVRLGFEPLIDFQAGLTTISTK